MLYRALEQVQGAGGGATVMVVDDLRELVGQLTGKGDFIGLPGAGNAGLLQAQHADHLAIDADAGVEHRIDVARAQGFGHLAGARVAHRIVRVDGAAAMQGFHVVGETADVDYLRQEVLLGRAVIRRNRHQQITFEVPQAGAVDFIDIVGAAGDQLGGFLQRVVAAVALAGQQQDQILLGAHSLKVQQLFLLGALVQFQGDLQAGILGFEVDAGHLHTGGGMPGT